MIDFHCHLDLYPDTEKVVRECEYRDLYVLSVTTTPSAWSGTTALASGIARIRTSLGLHPQLVHQRKGELELFERLLPKTNYVGEVGLDGTPEFKQHWDDQVAVFEHILFACEDAGGRILSIHSRRAASAVLDCLTEAPNAGMPILHWFTGTQRELERAIELGCWFSVGPTMLKSKNGWLLAEKMPRDRLLTESDGPFAQVDGRSALPWDCYLAVEALSKLWSVSESSVMEQLKANLRRVATNHSNAAL